MSDDAKLRPAAGLSKLWDDGETRRVRVGDGATMLPGRRLTVHLMVQPDVAGIMLNDRLLADQGLLSRFLITAPDSAAGLRLWHEPKWMASKASAAQCGSTAAGFEAWKKQFADEARARGVSTSTVAALMATTDSTANHRG